MIHICRWECQTWQRSVFISRPFHTQQSVIGIMFVFWGTGGLCVGVQGEGEGQCWLFFLVFLGQGYFPFQSKAFFFTTIRNGKGIFFGEGSFVIIKKNRKTDITCVFFSMTCLGSFFLTSKICMLCIRGWGHQIMAKLKSTQGVHKYHKY